MSSVQITSGAEHHGLSLVMSAKARRLATGDLILTAPLIFQLICLLGLTYILVQALHGLFVFFFDLHSREVEPLNMYFLH